MLNRKIAILTLALILSFPLLGYARGASPGQPFQYLQQQIDKMKEQLEDLQARSTPPTISYDSFCRGSFLNVEMRITASREIAYFAIQEQDGNPPANVITFVQPGVTSLTYQFTVDPGPEKKTLLLIAADTEGNINKSLLEIEPDICFVPICTPGQSQLCPVQNGACAGAVQYCSADGSSWLPCDYTQKDDYSPIEICWDRIDNDCDGQTDEGCPR